MFYMYCVYHQDSTVCLSKLYSMYAWCSAHILLNHASAVSSHPMKMHTCILIFVHHFDVFTIPSDLQSNNYVIIGLMNSCWRSRKLSLPDMVRDTVCLLALHVNRLINYESVEVIIENHFIQNRKRDVVSKQV